MRFELDLKPPMAVGLVFLGEEVLVGAWPAGAALASAGGALSPKSLVGTAGEDAVLSWWKMTCNRTGVVLMAATVF